MTVKRPPAPAGNFLLTIEQAEHTHAGVALRGRANGRPPGAGMLLVVCAADGRSESVVVGAVHQYIRATGVTRLVIGGLEDPSPYVGGYARRPGRQARDNRLRIQGGSTPGLTVSEHVEPLGDGGWMRLAWYGEHEYLVQLAAVRVRPSGPRSRKFYGRVVDEDGRTLWEGPLSCRVRWSAADALRAAKVLR